MASTGQFPDLQSVIALVKTLTNAQLKDILRSEALAVSGVKASLQLRIIDFIERLAQTGQTARYDALRKFIYTTANRVMPAVSSTPSYPQYQPPAVSQSISTQPRSSPLSIPIPSLGFTSGTFLSRLSFKDSPFYTILEPLTSTVECKVREQTRDSVELKVVLNSTVASRLQTDSNCRVMVYCASDTGLNQYTKSDVAFPHQVELKANLDEVKANLRGLKNKPGTTRPADVTSHIRKKPGYQNNIVMTYALTQKKFFVVVNLVQQHPIDDLVAELKARKTISREQVVREMRSRADDSEIVATSSVMSLKCPLSTLRIDVPCRSVVCTHNQCFDASSFLQLQEQAPTWTCPVCSKSTSFESLQVDQYVDDILRSTSTDVEQVVIEPDGTWTTPKSDDTTGANGVTHNPASDDDDLIEVNEAGFTPIKQESVATTLSLQQTPIQSREPSSAPSAARPSTNKRPAAQVIDLTASDDEEDLPVRPAKRPALNAPSHSFPALPSLSNSYTNGQDLPLSSQTNYSDTPSQRGGYDR